MYMPLTIKLKMPYSRAGAVTLLFLVILASFGITKSLSAQESATGTAKLVIEKKFSGPYPLDYEASQFTFTVSGYSDPIHLTAYTIDIAYGSIDLPVGTYQITEHGPSSFVPEEWTVQWSGAGCTNITAPQTTISINSDDIGKENFSCRADNQWRYGNLYINKIVVGTTTSPAEFNFSVTQGSNNYFDGAFEADGENELRIGAGSYSVLEDSYPDYVTTYSPDCSGTMPQGGSKSCTITNTYTTSTATSTGRIIIIKQTIPADSLTSFIFDPSWSDTNFSLVSGEQSTSSELLPGIYSITEQLPTDWIQTGFSCSDGSSATALQLDQNEVLTCTVTNTLSTTTEQLHRVFGYIWHDENENTVWDRLLPDPSNDEIDLDQWEVMITNGSVTKSTTTDESGYYYFEVPPGVWKVSEVVQNSWRVTYPAENEFVVEVVESIAQNTDTRSTSWWRELIEKMIPSVYAQAVLSYGPYNFGNVRTDTDNDDNDNNDNDTNHSSRKSSKRVSATSEPEPEPTILGDSVSLLPVGAPDTGAGGTSLPILPSSSAESAILNRNFARFRKQLTRRS
jgi:Prealbumin-like fold domain